MPRVSRLVPLAALALAALLASPAHAQEPLELTFAGLVTEFDAESAASTDFLHAFAGRRFDGPAAAAAAKGNAAFLEQLLERFADTDGVLKNRSYREIRITGTRDPREERALLGLPLAAAHAAFEAGRPVDAARYAIAGLHLACRLHAGRGVEGGAALVAYAEGLVPWLDRFLPEAALPPEALVRLRAYLDWYAAEALDLPRIYESERVRILARYFPMHPDELDRELLASQKIEDAWPEVAQSDRYWEYKEAEGILLRMHRLAGQPYRKRLAKFKAADADRAASKAVAKRLPHQMPFMARLERAATRVELAGLASACFAARARAGKFPASDKEFASAGIALPADRFAEGGARVKAVSRGGLLILYSVGANGIDDIFTRDDLVYRVVAR